MHSFPRPSVLFWRSGEDDGTVTGEGIKTDGHDKNTQAHGRSEAISPACTELALLLYVTNRRKCLQLNSHIVHTSCRFVRPDGEFISKIYDLHVMAFQQTVIEFEGNHLDAVHNHTCASAKPWRVWSGEDRNRNKWLPGLDPPTMEKRSGQVHSAKSFHPLPRCREDQRIHAEAKQLWGNRGKGSGGLGDDLRREGDIAEITAKALSFVEAPSK